MKTLVLINGSPSKLGMSVRFAETLLKAASEKRIEVMQILHIIDLVNGNTTLILTLYTDKRTLGKTTITLREKKMVIHA